MKKFLTFTVAMFAIGYGSAAIVRTVVLDVAQRAEAIDYRFEERCSDMAQHIRALRASATVHEGEEGFTTAKERDLKDVEDGYAQACKGYGPELYDGV